MNEKIEQIKIPQDKIVDLLMRMATREDITKLETKFDSNMERKYNALLTEIKWSNQLIESRMSDQIKNFKSELDWKLKTMESQLNWKLEMTEYRIAGKIKDVEYQVKDSAKVLLTHAHTTTNSQDNWDLVPKLTICFCIPFIIVNVIFWFVH